MEHRDAEETRSAQPEYPDELREQGVEGAVEVSYTVSEKGTVTGASVSRGSGHDALDDAALRAIRKFRYRPALVDGKPRAVQRKKRFVFRLSG